MHYVPGLSYINSLDFRIVSQEVVISKLQGRFKDKELGTSFHRRQEMQINARALCSLLNKITVDAFKEDKQNSCLACSVSKRTSGFFSNERLHLNLNLGVHPGRTWPSWPFLWIPIENS